MWVRVFWRNFTLLYFSELHCDLSKITMCLKSLWKISKVLAVPLQYSSGSKSTLWPQREWFYVRHGCQIPQGTTKNCIFKKIHSCKSKFFALNSSCNCLATFLCHFQNLNSTVRWFSGSFLEVPLAKTHTTQWKHSDFSDFAQVPSMCDARNM